MYPRTIDNGHGERMTFLGVEGDRLRISLDRRPGRRPADARPPPPDRDHPRRARPHRLRRRRRGADASPAPASTLTFDPGVEHRFWNAGEDELVLTGEVFPADNLEYFLTQVYASVAAHGGRPGAFDGAFLLTRYRTEFAMTSIPAPVRRFVFPLQALLGRAPRPLRPLRGRPGPGQPPARALHSPAARPAPVAQLDRASVYGTEGQRFESSRAR